VLIPYTLSDADHGGASPLLVSCVLGLLFVAITTFGLGLMGQVSALVEHFFDIDVTKFQR
jgi:hypothetical protein